MIDRSKVASAMTRYSYTGRSDYWAIFDSASPEAIGPCMAFKTEAEAHAYCRDQNARAAIASVLEQLQEPTWEMKDAGHEADLNCQSQDPWEVAAAIWRTMLARAKEEMTNGR